MLEGRDVPATITVDTALDVVANDNLTSLREAIDTANQAQEPTVILFNKNLLNATLTLGSQLPAIAAGKTAYIDGSIFNITIQRDPSNAASFRLFQVNFGGGLILGNLTLLNGAAPNLDGGGAVYSSGSLTVSACTLRNNTAGGSGGAVYSDAGTLGIYDSQLNGNSALSRGGAVAVFGEGTAATIAHSVIGLNYADLQGGGVYLDSDTTATIQDVEVAGNQAAKQGAASGRLQVN